MRQRLKNKDVEVGKAVLESAETAMRDSESCDSMNGENRVNPLHLRALYYCTRYSLLFWWSFRFDDGTLQTRKIQMVPSRHHQW